MVSARAWPMVDKRSSCTPLPWSMSARNHAPCTTQTGTHADSPSRRALPSSNLQRRSDQGGRLGCRGYSRCTALIAALQCDSRGTAPASALRLCNQSNTCTSPGIPYYALQHTLCQLCSNLDHHRSSTFEPLLLPSGMAPDATPVPAPPLLPTPCPSQHYV